MNKVYGGTKRSDCPDLCETCSFGLVVRGHSLKEVLKDCRMGVTPCFRVSECPQFHKRGTPTLSDFEAAAWHLDLDKGKRVVGFLDPQKWKDRHPEEGCGPPFPAYPGDPFR